MKFSLPEVLITFRGFSFLCSRLVMMIVSASFLLFTACIAKADSTVTICSETISEQSSKHFVPGVGYSTETNQTLSHFIHLIRETKNKLESCFTQSEIADSGYVEYCIDTWNTERYGYSYRYNQKEGGKKIVLGFQSLSVLANIATAIAISESLKIEGHYRWWMSYALYLRRTNDWENVTDPLTILEKSDPEYQKVISTESKFYFNEMLSFILAHELSHVLLKHGESYRSKTVTATERKVEIRRWEEEADRKALEILSRKVAYDNGLGPSGASLVFLNFHLIDGWWGNENATHPADTKRMQSLSNFILNDLDHSMWPNSEWEEMRNKSESFGKNAILAEDPSYFDGFNKAASEVQLGMLKFDNFK